MRHECAIIFKGPEHVWGRCGGGVDFYKTSKGFISVCKFHHGHEGTYVRNRISQEEYEAGVLLEE